MSDNPTKPKRTEIQQEIIDLIRFYERRADPGFTKGYKYHGYADEPVSDACGDGKHSECTFDLTKCHCKYRAGHNTMHSYVFKSGRAASQEGTE